MHPTSQDIVVGGVLTTAISTSSEDPGYIYYVDGVSQEIHFYFELVGNHRMVNIIKFGTTQSELVYAITT